MPGALRAARPGPQNSAADSQGTGKYREVYSPGGQLHPQVVYPAEQWEWLVVLSGVKQDWS